MVYDGTLGECLEEPPTPAEWSNGGTRLGERELDGLSWERMEEVGWRSLDLRGMEEVGWDRKWRNLDWRGMKELGQSVCE